MKATAAVFVAAAAYFLLFVPYGFQVEDEGLLLFKIDRVLRGQLPYTDFHTGYTPGYFASVALAMDWLGGSVAGLRVVFALLNAATAAGLFALTAGFVGRTLALVPPLVWIAFLPVYPGAFASFNVPYPAWIATFLWIAMAHSLSWWIRRASLLSLVCAGIVGAAAFAVKPNAGAYCMAAAVWIVGATSAAARPIDRWAARLAGILVAGGVWAAFGFVASGMDAIVHLVPLVMITLLFVATGVGEWPKPGAPRALASLTALGLGFVSVSSLWMVATVSRIGVSGFAREILFIGSDAASLYWLAHPLPDAYSVAVLVALGAVVGGGWLVARRRISVTVVVVAAAAAAALALMVLARVAVMPEGLAQSLRGELGQAGYWLVLTANWAGLSVLLAAAYVGADRRVDRRLLALVPLAIAMYWQLYPRTDFTHLVISMPLAAVLATVLLARVLDWWNQGVWPGWAPARLLTKSAVVAAAITITLLELWPATSSAIGCLGKDPVAGLTPRLPVCVEDSARDDLADLGRVADYLRDNTAIGEQVLHFPALGAVLFAAARPSALPRDYWFPGRPNNEDEKALVAELAANPPRLVVTINSGWAFFLYSPTYFGELRSFVRGRYTLAARFGRYDVLARNDVRVAAAGEVAAEVATSPVHAAAPALPVEAVLARRLQAIRRWQAWLDPARASRPELAEDPGAAILQLRALRDGGDLRAAGWLIAGYNTANPRVHREAVAAMGLVVHRFLATANRLAGDLDLADYALYLKAHREAAKAILDDPRPDVRAFADAVLWVGDTVRVGHVDWSGLMVAAMRPPGLWHD